jgi:hypothetical protein
MVVERFYHVVYGERIPVIHSAVMSGGAEVRPFGRPTLPARFRFAHVAGRSYRHYIEATFFGLPIMKINESYVDGHSRVETPAGVEEGEPKVEQAANLGMWAELSGIPAVLLTDPRARWEPLQADAAILVVPGDSKGEERFIVRFDPVTGLVTLISKGLRVIDDTATQSVSWAPVALAEQDTRNRPAGTRPRGSTETTSDQQRPGNSEQETLDQQQGSGYFAARTPSLTSPS